MSDEKAIREKRGPEVPGGVSPKTVGPEQARRLYRNRAACPKHLRHELCATSAAPTERRQLNR